MGTPEVYHLTKRLCKHSTEKTKEVTTIVMKGKLNDAWKALRKEKYEERLSWHDLKRELELKHKVDAFNAAWCAEKNRYFINLRKKKKQKVKWIKRKYYQKPTIPETYKGIQVGDQPLDERFNTEPECYGNTEVDEEEAKVLKLHPKYSVFDQVDATDCEAEIEKSLAKIRWKRKQDERETMNDGNDRNTENNSKKETFNIEKKEFNFNYSRSTELPFNTCTYMPKQLEMEEETKLQSIKHELMRITKEYIESNNGSSMQNLNEDQKKGLSKLNKRQSKREIVVFQTDKSGKMSIDAPENYAEAASPHIENDIIITQEEYEKIEETTNAHAKCWMRMLNVGKKTNNDERYKSSMLTHNSRPPTLYIYRKDHKQFEDRIKGPPVRPLCDVSDSYGHKLSYFLCTILKEVNDEQVTICDSTEDMVAAINNANNGKKVNGNSVIGSMDVKALYPSLDIEFTIDIICDEFYKSDITIQDVDYEEIGLYLSLNRNEKYLKEKGIEEYCPKRKSKNGRRPKITGSGIQTKKENRFRPWKRPERESDEQKRRKMLTECLRIGLEAIMKNHTYKFQDVIRKQKEGGAIGIDLTGEMARIFMCWWDRQLLEKLENFNIKPFLYKRYVDDINLGTEAIGKEYEYENGELKLKSAQAEENENDDAKTFRIIQEIGDDIHRSIKLTTDVPSKNEDGKVPILDLKCWIGEKYQEDETRYVILHEHYIKDVSSKAVLHRDSAISINNKRTILTQQCLQVLLNCSEHLEEERRNEHLSFFMARMQSSGYDHEFRLEVLKSALNAFEKKKEAEKDGKKMHRERTWNRTERRKQKKERKNNWYRTGEVESVLFIPATPNAELKRRMQDKLKSKDARIKVIEKSGTKIVRLLQRNDPFKKKECTDAANCLVCSSQKPGGCRDNSVVYSIQCTGGCEHKYIGQTGSNAYTRGKQHLEQYKKKAEESALWKHCVNDHDGHVQKFEMNVIDRVRNDSTKRQILEAVRLQNAPERTSMNSRGEWNTARVPRVQIRTDVI